MTTVSPNFGSAAGGDTITISGSNLGNGSDITNVTLAGFNVAQITSQNAGQVVVRSGASGTSTSGAAVVYSTSFGASTKAAAFTYYAWPDIAVLGIDGSRITNGAPARAAAGTDFRSLSLNASLTHTLTITNDSGNPLTISGITTSGTGSAAFRILNPPSSVPGMSVAMFDVQFTASAVTSYDAMVSIANNSTSTPYAFGVHGSGLALSTNHAPFSGGMTVTLVGAGLGNGSDITNVTVCGVKASIVSQSATQLVFAVGYGGTGTGDILIQSASAGDTIVRNGFTYNQQGHIFGAFMGWNAISNLPSPRIGAAAASVSNVIYVIGGIHDDYGSALATVFRFDTAHPELGWSSVSNLPAGRYGSAAASVGSKLYVLSGQDSGWNFMPSAFVYDTALPAAGWQSISNLPFARWRHGAAAANGKIYVTGGEGNALVNYADCCEYDPAHPESGWKTIRSLPGERGTHGCESIDGKVYVFGGIDNGANYLQSTLVYDPFNPELGWVATANLPKMLAYLHSAQANGRMYTVDGNSGDGDLHCYEYDLNAGGGTWSTLPVALPDGTAEHAACGAGGKIYRLGGESTSSEALEGSWSPGIYPIAGPVTGGITVAISGENLGNGSDITNVTLCGIPVSSIVSQSGTQVVVIAGPAPGETNGDVMVFSQNYGATIKQNGYTYSYPHTTVFAASGLTITNTEPPSVAKGTDFGEVGPFGLSRSFVITNSGGADLIISGVTTSGPGAAQFQVKNMPLTLAGLSAAGFNIVFAPQAVGIHTAVVVIASNASNTPNYQIIVQGIGYVVSPSNGPAAGSNTVCIQGLNLGNGSDITNVIVHGTGAAITSQNPTQVIVQVGASGPGVGNILVQSTSQGSKRPINAYRYNQPGHIFGPFAGWTTVSSFPDSRSYIPCGTALGKVYAYGGYVQNLGGRVESWVYDPAQPTLGWTSISNLPVAAYGQAGVGVGDKLYCLDGWWGGPVRSAYVYDPMQPTLGWVSISNMPIGALDLGATTVSGKVCAVGGDLNGPLSSSVNTYDPAHPELAWAGISNLPVGNAELGAANVDGRPYSVGGLGASRSLFEYDPYEPENGWTSLTNLPMDVRGLGAAGVNGRLFAIGGYNASLGGVNNVWVYDPQYPENGWTSFPGLPDARDYAGVTALNGQQIYVIGGYNQWLGQQSSVFVGGFSSGVSPSVGPTAGGNAVTIFGCHLGSGSDITNVTLCGISVAAITSQSATQVVVTAGASPSETNGDVVVYSTAFGITIETNGYTYKQPYAIFLGADGGVITNNAAASVTRGTDFGGLAVNAHASRPFAVTNYGARLEITNVSITGSGAAQFSVSVLPVLPVYVDPLTRSNFSITFSPTAIGLQTAVVTVTSTAGNDPVFRLNLAGRGYVLSTNIGPNAGGNVLTIFGQGLGNGADITNVTICGIQASILSQNATQVVVRAGGGGGGGGACDILIQSASQGDQIVSEAYTYNSASAIHGPLTGWISVSNLPAPREYLAAASCNGKVYAIGGDNNNTPCSDVFVYDPAAPAAGWTTVSNLPMPLTQIAAASISGKVYAVGGYSGGGQSPTYQYDPNQPQSGWVAVSNMPAVSYGLGATAVGGTLYAVGGADSMGDTRSSVWSYNPNRPQDGWQIAPSLPGPREYMTPVAIKGKLYAMGGLADPSTVTSDTLEYDPLHPEAGWTSVSNLPAGRTYHAAAVAYGRAYVLGGYYESGPDVCMYHPTEPANGWTAAAGMPQGGWGIAAVGLNNTIYAFGGYWGSSDQVAAWQSVFDSGVSPASGRVAGGDTITIAGDDMGDGGDVTNVYLCGIPVSAILSQSPTQIVVTAGASGVVRTGDVVVCSVSFGSSVKSNAFVYNGWIIVASAGLHGTISPTGSVAMVQGSATNFVCTADAYYHIGSLLTNGAADATASGFAVYTSAWAAVTADGTVSVSFAENLAPLGTPEWWLATYGWTNDFGAAETNDADHDGSLNWQEYLAGTDPTNGNDYLKFDGIFPQSGALTLDLMSHTGRLYDIDSSSNLLNGAGWSPVTGNVAGTESTLSITNSPAPGTLLYRIKVRKP